MCKCFKITTGSILTLCIKRSREKILIKKSLLSTHAIYYFQKYHQLIKCAIRLIPLLFKSCVKDDRQILLLTLCKFNSFMVEVPKLKKLLLPTLKYSVFPEWIAYILNLHIVSFKRGRRNGNEAFMKGENKILCMYSYTLLSLTYSRRKLT